MQQGGFDPSPLIGFLDMHASDRKAADAALSAVVASFQAIVRNGFVFERLHVEDLELVRRDLEILLGFRVREVRVIALEAFFASKPGESEEARGLRLSAARKRVEDEHLDMDEILGCFEAFADVHVPEKVQEDLEEAIEAAFKDVKPPFADPFMNEAIDAMGMTLLLISMLALCAAVVDDPIMARRVAAFLPWLTRGVPLGALKAEPGVFTFVVSQAPA